MKSALAEDPFSPEFDPHPPLAPSRRDLMQLALLACAATGCAHLPPPGCPAAQGAPKPCTHRFCRYFPVRAP